MAICKNCGGEFDGRRSNCPYCGTMHKAGAYANFRKKISDIIDQLLGIKKEVELSTSQIIIKSIIRGVLLASFFVACAFVVSLFTNVNYYNDRPYDERRLEDIIWQNENIHKLDEAYEKNDLDTIEKLFYENTSVVYKWQHYPSFALKSAYKSINESFDTYFGEYALEQCLYFLYYPDYFARISTMSLEEIEEYETMRDSLINTLVSKGYSESELHNIYEQHKDDYGYLRASELKKYIKGEGNG